MSDGGTDLPLRVVTHADSECSRKQCPSPNSMSRDKSTSRMLGRLAVLADSNALVMSHRSSSNNGHTCSRPTSMGRAMMAASIAPLSTLANKSLVWSSLSSTRSDGDCWRSARIRLGNIKGAMVGIAPSMSVALLGSALLAAALTKSPPIPSSALARLTTSTPMGVSMTCLLLRSTS